MEDAHEIEKKLKRMTKRRYKLAEVVAREEIRENIYRKNKRLNKPGFLYKYLKALEGFLKGEERNIGHKLPPSKESEDVSYFSRFIRQDEGLNKTWDKKDKDREVFKKERGGRIKAYTSELSNESPYVKTTLNEIIEIAINDFIEEGGSSPIDFSILSINDKVKVVEKAVEPGEIVRGSFEKKYSKYKFLEYIDIKNSFSVDKGGRLQDIIFINKEVSKEEATLEILNIKDKNTRFVFLSKQGRTIKYESLSVEEALSPFSPLSDKENSFYKDYPKTTEEVYKEEVEDMVLAYFQQHYVKDEKYPEIIEGGLSSAINYVLRGELPNGEKYAGLQNDNVIERIKYYFEHYKGSVFNEGVEKSPFSKEISSFINDKKPMDLNFYNELTPLT